MKKIDKEVLFARILGYIILSSWIFVGLRLVGFIHWNWFWVSFPAIFGFVVSILLILIGKILIKLGGETLP